MRRCSAVSLILGGFLLRYSVALLAVIFALKMDDFVSCQSQVSNLGSLDNRYTVQIFKSTLERTGFL